MDKIKCSICYKLFNPKYKYNHNKTKHHIICNQITIDINLKNIENLFIKDNKNNYENNNIDNFIKNNFII